MIPKSAKLFDEVAGAPGPEGVAHLPARVG